VEHPPARKSRSELARDGPLIRYEWGALADAPCSRPLVDAASRGVPLRENPTPALDVFNRIARAVDIYYFHVLRVPEGSKHF